ncbi:MAG: AAA domain-containing protein [Promethearchaeota archaeon]
MSKIAKRYSLGKKINSIFSIFSSDIIEEYQGFDNLHQRPVIIKSFKIPKSKDAEILAITLWEREIRLTRKAMGLSGGSLLVPIIDAFIDKSLNKLFIITTLYGKSLEEWVNDGGGLWFLDDINQETRKEFWNLFNSFLNGVGALHQAKLLHRNINPGAIYYSVEDESNIIKLGGVTWSLYLHNLNLIPEQITKKKQSFSLFQAPELLHNKDLGKSRANPFARDIFSLGMILCYVFYPEFPEIPPNNYSDWKKFYNQIINYFISSKSNFNNPEIELITSSISLNPTERPKTTFEFKRKIQAILESFEVETKQITERPKVNWYNLPESYFLRDLARSTSIKIDEIISNPNKWLLEDFQNSVIYSTGIEDYPLILQNNKDMIFSLKPIFQKKYNIHNKDIQSLNIIPTRRRSYILSVINKLSPIAILINSLQFSSDIFYSDPLSLWRKLWSIAESECQKKKEVYTEEERFTESLKIMLEAEKELDSAYILQYRKKKVFRKPEDKVEKGTIEISLNFNKEMNRGDRNSIIELLTEYKNRNGGIVELSASSTPSSSWNHRCEWVITEINRKELKCSIERQLKRKNKELSKEGTLRPFEMNLSLSLYKRKESVIERVKNNDLLLSALLNPRFRTFYLGLEHQTDDETVSSILNTIPMFLVQGPPGTGKTWVASTVVAKILENNPYSRILISSKDHHPLDHLVQAVIDKIPKNLDPQPIIIRAMSSDKKREYEANDFIIKYIDVNQTKKILEVASKNTQQLKLHSQKLEDKWKQVVNENKKNPSLIWMDEIKKVANIIFATSTSSTIEWLGQNAAPYDWVILEEAAKSYPVELLIPMSLGHRWLLIGDQKQLPPYMYNDIANTVSDLLDEEQAKLERDVIEYQNIRENCLKNIKLFENLYNNFKTVKVLFSEENYSPCSQLNKQYRLPPLISDMVSKVFYDTKFKTKQIIPEEGDPFELPEYLENNQLIWIDTPHSSINNKFEEKRGSEGSYYNYGELEIITSLLSKIKVNLKYTSYRDLDIVFLTPYSAQKEELTKIFHSKPLLNFKAQHLARCCHTVDSYQGKQADVVFVSLVRNNDSKNIKGALGFLTAIERLNVMFSRARKRMVIIGCSKHIKKFKDNKGIEAILGVYKFIRDNGLILTYDQFEGI